MASYEAARDELANDASYPLIFIMDKDEFKDILKHGSCTGTWCKGSDTPGEALHTCPFAEEIYGDTRLCNCCGDCATQCGHEI